VKVVVREERTQDEVIIDDALILALYSLAQDRSSQGTVGDRLKAMKLVFLANHDMFRQQAKGLNCTFFRWDWGPMSNEVYRAWEQLIYAGFLEEEEDLVVTPRGKEFAEAFLAEVLSLEENRFFLMAIRHIADEWGDKSRSEMLSAVYKVEISPVGSPLRMTVADAPRTIHFTEALDEHETKIALRVPEGWLETLALQLNPKATESVRRAQEDVREGRVIEGDEIWFRLESSSL
jgi:uncharacterized phage-associated protein